MNLGLGTNNLQHFLFTLLQLAILRYLNLDVFRWSVFFQLLAHFITACNIACFLCYWLHSLYTVFSFSHLISFHSSPLLVLVVFIAPSLRFAFLKKFSQYCCFILSSIIKTCNIPGLTCYSLHTCNFQIIVFFSSHFFTLWLISLAFAFSNISNTFWTVIFYLSLQ